MRHSVSRTILCAGLAVAGAGLRADQITPQAEAKLQFEVASVKPSKTETAGPSAVIRLRIRQNQIQHGVPTADPGRVRLENWSLKELVAAAYRLRMDQVSGPAWMDDQRFDIEARLPEGAKGAQASEMMQSLLAERFGVQAHQERKELSGFVLVVGKRGPKLEESHPGPAPVDSLTPEERQQRIKEDVQKRMAEMKGRMQAGEKLGNWSRSNWPGITTAQFADHLTPLAGAPVTDETGLTGKYDFEVETRQGASDQPDITIFDAVEKLGLKLEARKVQVDLLVVNKVARTPTEN